MHTNGICTHCGKKIRFWISLCKECKNKKWYSAAIVSQNKKKLKKLLEERSITIERIDKFILYSNNILKFSKVLIEYKEENNGKIIDRLKKIWVISCWFILLIGIILIQI